LSTGAPVTSEPLTPSQVTFHIEEYKALRAEIMAQGKSTLDVYLYAVLASGGIAAWLLTHRAEILVYGDLAPKVAGLIPLVLVALGFYWSRIFSGIIVTIGRYMRQLEDRLATSGLGWETFLATSPDERTLGLEVPRRMRTAWIALAVANLSLAVLA
jgi:hypothetical protein